MKGEGIYGIAHGKWLGSTGVRGIVIRARDDWTLTGIVAIIFTGPRWDSENYVLSSFRFALFLLLLILSPSLSLSFSFLFSFYGSSLSVAIISPGTGTGVRAVHCAATCFSFF